MTLSYPPEAQVLTASEERALQAMKLTAAERAGVQKLVAKACHPCDARGRAAQPRQGDRKAESPYVLARLGGLNGPLPPAGALQL